MSVTHAEKESLKKSNQKQTSKPDTPNSRPLEPTKSLFIPQEINNTGIPNQMKTRFENASDLSFNDVRVHYNSDKPAQLQAFAYTQGNQVYVAPGQERHLGHELGHVIQQKQGRVKPTMRLDGQHINNDNKLETEATQNSIAIQMNLRDIDKQDSIDISHDKVIQGFFHKNYFGYDKKSYNAFYYEIFDKLLKVWPYELAQSISEGGGSPSK